MTDDRRPMVMIIDYVAHPWGKSKNRLIGQG